MGEKLTRTVATRLTEGQARELEQRAEEGARTISQEIRRVLQKELAGTKRKKD